MTLRLPGYDSSTNPNQNPVIADGIFGYYPYIAEFCVFLQSIIQHDQL
jgi:hypothetical protein